jgi:membrane protein
MTTTEIRKVSPARPGLDYLWEAWDVLKVTLAEASKDRIPAVAAGATFFVLLALFPAVASVVSLYGLFADRASIAHVVDTAAPFLPGGAVMVLDTELHRLVAQKPEKLNFAFFAGLAVAIWSASGGVKTLSDGLNVAYEVRETRSFLRLIVHALLITIACILLATCLIALAVVLPAELARLPIRRELLFAWTVLRWPAAFLCCVVMQDILYKIGPDRQHTKWRWISWGSAIASLLWILGTLLFAWYAQNFGSYDRVYGDLGAAVGFLTWIWLSLVILLAGAELNCEIERRTVQTFS